METNRSAWAMGYAAFAAIVLLLVGILHIMAGLAGILEDEFYVATPNWLLQFDATTWGWIHLIGGILVVLGGLSILKGHMYGRIIGVTVASISLVANFAWLPYREFWGLVMIFLDIAIIWALTVHGRDLAQD